MLNMILSTTALLSIMFMFLSNPLSFGLILLIQTLLVAMITGTLNNNFWFSYILFLIMVGGMLILFIYMTSVASNEKFKFSMKMSMIIPMYSLLMASNLTDKMFTSLNVKNNELATILSKDMSMSKYMNFPNNFIMATMIIYLLITLIMAVKITNMKKGPLRQMF
uniref:NADH dehydrogenase subunit 6 n=1 Tax=Chlorophorus annularis TaxID=2586298 RepID=UPI001EF9D659|nr:NADH dehydrogenase subunit 6 [Chlorophorus annularis]ULA45460.1 NADH dehydrogenase subunit 6 [Chlorophorus annularis]